MGRRRAASGAVWPGTASSVRSRIPVRDSVTRSPATFGRTRSAPVGAGCGSLASSAISWRSRATRRERACRCRCGVPRRPDEGRALRRRGGVAAPRDAELAPVGGVRDLHSGAPLLDDLVTVVAGDDAFRLGEDVSGHDGESARVPSHRFVFLEREADRALALPVAAFANEAEQIRGVADVAEAVLQALVDVAEARFVVGDALLPPFGRHALTVVL